MILCVTPNPAIDRTLIVPGFRTGKIYRPTEVIALPGGKGINVARVLKTLGDEPLATGWIGASGAQFMERGLTGEGIAVDFIHIENETRVCTSIYDPENGELSEIYEKGSPLMPEDADTFENRLPASFARSQAAVFSGSLPPGLDPRRYAAWIRTAREAGLVCALDSSGDTLRIGLEEGHPHLIKPNREEFCRLTGLNEAIGMPALAGAAAALSSQFDTFVFLSLGAHGALAADSDRVHFAEPPPMHSISAVGSGDAFLAAAIMTLTKKGSPEEALRRGVAAGTANSLMLGAGRLNPGEYNRILSLTKLRPMNIT